MTILIFSYDSIKRSLCTLWVLTILGGLIGGCGLIGGKRGIRGLLVSKIRKVIADDDNIRGLQRTDIRFIMLLVVSLFSL